MSRLANDGGSFSGIDPQQLHELINSLNRHSSYDGDAERPGPSSATG